VQNVSKIEVEFRAKTITAELLFTQPCGAENVQLQPFGTVPFDTSEAMPMIQKRLADDVRIDTFGIFGKELLLNKLTRFLSLSIIILFPVRPLYLID